MKSLLSSKPLWVIILLAVLFFPSLASAQDPLVPCGGPGQPECELCHLFEIFGRLVNFLRIAASALGIVVLLAASIILITSAGDPQKVDRAKKILFGTIIGLALIYLGWGIVRMLYEALGTVDDPTHWFNICP